MKITADLFEAYIKCSTKCWLLSQGEVGLGNAYADWYHAQNASYRSTEVKRLQDDVDQNKCVIGRHLHQFLDLAAQKWRVAVDMLAQSQFLESCIHSVERLQFEDTGKTDQFIPIYFVYSNKITQDDKLRLAFDAAILSEILGSEISFGKIIHGEHHITTKIDISTLRDKVKVNFRGRCTVIQHLPT